GHAPGLRFSQSEFVRASSMITGTGYCTTASRGVTAPGSTAASRCRAALRRDGATQHCSVTAAQRHDATTLCSVAAPRSGVTVPLHGSTHRGPRPELLAAVADAR